MRKNRHARSALKGTAAALAVALVATVGGVVVPARADTLLVEQIQKEPANAYEGVPRPRRGMTMERVEAVFGRPKKATQPVGRPPIVRWTYPTFVVFFERDVAIDVVVPRPATTAELN